MTATPVDGVPAPPPADPRAPTPRIEIGFSMRTVALGLAILLGIVLVVVVKDALMSIALARVFVLGLEVTRTISFALLGNVAISIIAGTVVGIAAVLVDAPSPAVLALIVGLFDLIPQIGSTIAAIIVVTVTLDRHRPGAAAIMLIVILVYQQVENYLIQPAVMRTAVELSGFATIAVVMVGGALLGVVGAILAVPVAASVKIVVREVTAGRRERMAALREAEAPQPA